jgi:uncharacterized protein DUF4446
MNDAWQPFLSGLGAAASSPNFILSAAFTIATVIVYHWTIARPRLRRMPAARVGPALPGAPPDLTDLRNRIAALESAAAGALANVGFVRFNAFPDVGSELSYALAVVDGRGDGFVVSSIYSREEVRTYAKSVKRFEADKDVSGEEQQALQIAKERAGRSR